jgi:20S proteasome alpha/beta subunit
VFSIVNPGDLFCYDAIGFAAVGSGAPHAVYSLIESGYKKSMDGKTVFELVEKAKHRSEVAPGVGRGTEIISVPEVKHV